MIDKFQNWSNRTVIVCIIILQSLKNLNTDPVLSLRFGIRRFTRDCFPSLITKRNFSWPSFKLYRSLYKISVDSSKARSMRVLPPVEKRKMKMLKNKLFNFIRFQYYVSTRIHFLIYMSTKDAARAVTRDKVLRYAYVTLSEDL